MKIINQSVELITQEPGLEGMYKQIELAGRTCYHSLDKITEDSAKKFVDRMIKSGHGAMLEHGTVYLMIHDNGNIDIQNNYAYNNYSNIIWHGNYAYVTTNLRVLVENNWLGDLQYWCEPTEHHERRTTVLWHCDRPTGESFIRHRVFSFARQSTRYCNYSKDKFKNNITFVKPSWIDDRVIGEYCPIKFIQTYDMRPIDEVLPSDQENELSWLYALAQNEIAYLSLTKNGWSAEKAREVLPFSVYSPLVMTGFNSDYNHFLHLRDDFHAHPDARYLAKEFIKLTKGFPGIHEKNL